MIQIWSFQLPTNHGHYDFRQSHRMPIVCLNFKDPSRDSTEDAVSHESFFLCIMILISKLRVKIQVIKIFGYDEILNSVPILFLGETVFIRRCSWFSLVTWNSHNSKQALHFEKVCTLFFSGSTQAWLKQRGKWYMMSQYMGKSFRLPLHFQVVC